MQNYTKGIIYASTTAFFWGFLPVFLKIATHEFDPITIVWSRFAVAFLILSAWQLIKKSSSFQILKRPPLFLIIAGIALSWNYLGYMFGVDYTTPSNAQLFIQAGPIILTIAGLIIFKEKLRRNQIIGFIIAIIGFAFFYQDQLFAFFESQGKYNSGVILTLSGAFAWAVYATLQKKLVTKFSVDSLNIFLFGFPALVYLPFTDLSPLLHLHWSWWVLLVFLGLNTLIAYSCLARALKYLEANKASIILILNPIITFITMGILTELNVNWVELERFSIITILGAGLVFSGAILVVKKTRKKLNNTGHKTQ